MSLLSPEQLSALSDPGGLGRRGASTPDRPVDRTVIFVKVLNEAIVERLMERRDCLLLLRDVDRERAAPLGAWHDVLYSLSPRYAFAEVMRQLVRCRLVRQERTEIPGTVAVMPGARVAPLGVRVGAGSTLYEYCTVGGPGFGIAQCPGHPPLRVPHIGGVELGRAVEVGSFTTVRSGTIEPTIIEDEAKVDDHVHVGHNCHVGARALVTAGTVLGGGAEIGEDAFLGLNCTVLQKRKIGAGATVGAGAVIFHDIPAGATVAGNPGRRLPKE